MTFDPSNIPPGDTTAWTRRPDQSGSLSEAIVNLAKLGCKITIEADGIDPRGLTFAVTSSHQADPEQLRHYFTAEQMHGDGAIGDDLLRKIFDGMLWRFAKVIEARPAQPNAKPTNEESVEAIEGLLALATKGEVYTTLSVKLEDLVTRRRAEGCVESKTELSALLDALKNRKTELIEVNVTQEYGLPDRAPLDHPPSAKGIDFDIVVSTIYGG